MSANRNIPLAGFRFKDYQKNYWRETRIDVEDATRRYTSGESLRDIADVYGVTRERVRQVLKLVHGESIAAISLYAREARN